MPNLTTLLAILQQSEYDFEYFDRWYTDHQSDHVLEIKPKVWTPKLKLIAALAQALGWLPVSARLKVATSLTQPGEWLVRKLTYGRAWLKLRQAQNQGLVVVAFSGSYGKTSTKQITAHVLSQFAPTLATSKSINTPLGIAQFVLQRLKPEHQYLLVELGEYYQGDITQLGQFVKPNYGVICPVGRQHLERMGNLDTIAATILELAAVVKSPTQILIHESLRPFIKTPDLGSWYGHSPTCQWRLTSAQVTRAGTEGKLVTATQTQNIFSPLFGEHQLVNSLPSLWLAQQLALDQTKALQALRNTPFILHRHQPIFAENEVLILDNGYNSNPDSAMASLKLLAALPASRRFVITPGFVELGAASQELHYSFGQQLAKQADFLGILESPNAKFIEQGWLAEGGRADHLVRAKSQEQAVTQLKSHFIPNSVILFENNLPEVYI